MLSVAFGCCTGVEGQYSSKSAVGKRKAAAMASVCMYVTRVTTDVGQVSFEWYLNCLFWSTCERRTGVTALFMLTRDPQVVAVLKTDLHFGVLKMLDGDRQSLTAGHSRILTYARRRSSFRDLRSTLLMPRAPIASHIIGL